MTITKNAGNGRTSIAWNKPSVVGAVVLAAALGLAACGGSNNHKPAAAPVGAAVGASSISGTPAAPATGGSAVSTSTSPAGTSTSPATAAVHDPAAPATKADACPVSDGALFADLKGSTSAIFARAGKPVALRDTQCYRDFAAAATATDGNHGTVQILFGYDSATRKWSPLNLGSAGYCAGYVSPEVAVHFTGCS